MNKLAGKLMYNCEQIGGFVYDYVDQKLNFLTRQRFEIHLKTCPGCNKYVELYSQAANPTEFVKQNPIPEELKAKTLSFLEKEGILKKE